MQNDVESGEVPTEEIITVGSASESVQLTGPKPFDVVRHNARVRNLIIYVLLVAVFALISLHYYSIIFTDLPPEKLDRLEKFFGQWFAAMTGLLGSAVGYYFKERQEK